jgi:hypothetical protein
VTQAEFQVQIERLRSNYGQQAYGTERASILWREISQFSAKWFSTVVDQFIGSERQAPMLDKFREEAAKERERVWQREKKQNAMDAKEFFEGSYDDTEKLTIIQTIKARTMKKMSDEHYAQFVEVIDRQAKYKTASSGACRQCDGTGIHFDESNTVYRCSCHHGQKDRRAFGGRS